MVYIELLKTVLGMKEDPNSRRAQKEAIELQYYVGKRIVNIVAGTSHIQSPFMMVKTRPMSYLKHVRNSLHFN